MRLLSGAPARILHAILFAVIVAAAVQARAHEGHDHADGPAAGVAASPRVAAVSERYQFVGIVEGEVLIVYLDRAADNAPVTTAAIEVTFNGQAFQAEPQANGTYEVTAPLLKRAGKLEVLIGVVEAGTSDILAGALTIASAGGTAAAPSAGLWFRLTESDRGGTTALLLLAAGAGVAAAWIRWRRHAAALMLAAAFLSASLIAGASAHEGHDHGADIRASSGNGPQRRADGTIFLPKPSQRLLDVRTAAIDVQRTTKVVRLMGRVAANPNFSGVVQSSIAGRYEAPPGGVPPLGARVKAGEPLGRVTPLFASIDSSDMAQTLGDIEQRLSIARAKLTRQQQLLRTQVVAQAVVDETRLEVEGLAKRRSDLLAARARPEELRASVDGVIAVSRAISGQVVAPADKLFEIIDPTRVLVEALVFDQVDPDAVRHARAILAGETSIALRLLGRSRALQQHYTLMQFEVADAPAPLSVGMPAIVMADSGAPVSGLFVPRAALAQAPNGPTIVFEHREPELFVPRAVRVEPFDEQRVMVVGGLEPGTKIVVRGAPLVAQVR